MAGPIILATDRLRLTLWPEHGAVVTALEGLGPEGWRPILAPARRGAARDPTAGSLFVMVPWCNRLSAGGVWGADGFHLVPPTWHSTSMPVHGTGWLRPWTVADLTRAAVQLDLQDVFGPYRYSARLRFALSGDSAAFEVEVVNRGDLALPFGVGFHPFFPWESGSKLGLNVTKVVAMGADGLPAQTRKFDRSRPMTLRGGKPIGRLRSVGVESGGDICLEEAASRTVLRHSFGLRNVLLWSPAGRPFLCVEPMSHGVDVFCHERKDATALLRSGEAMRRRIEIRRGSANEIEAF